jgi:hypothetical protein
MLGAARGARRRRTPDHCGPMSPATAGGRLPGTFLGGREIRGAGCRALCWLGADRDEASRLDAGWKRPPRAVFLPGGSSCGRSSPPTPPCRRRDAAPTCAPRRERARPRGCRPGPLATGADQEHVLELVRPRGNAGGAIRPARPRHALAWQHSKEAQRREREPRSGQGAPQVLGRALSPRPRYAHCPGSLRSRHRSQGPIAS